MESLRLVVLMKWVNFFWVNFFFGFAVLISLSVIVCSRESGWVVGPRFLVFGNGAWMVETAPVDAHVDVKH